MQFLQITDDMTLSQLIDRVGAKNVDEILQYNSVKRTHAIGEAYNHMVDVITYAYTELNSDEVLTEVSYKNKIDVLNTLTEDADVFEAAALQSEDGWKLLASIGTMPGYLRIPPTITLPDSTDILGGTDTPIAKTTYNKAMNYLKNNENVDPIIFNTYSDRQSGAGYTSQNQVADVYQWFKIPWGEITLYSSISNTSMEFPVYPEVANPVAVQIIVLKACEILRAVKFIVAACSVRIFDKQVVYFLSSGVKLRKGRAVFRSFRISVFPKLCR